MTEARYEEAIRYLREQTPAALLREGGFGWDNRTLDGVWAELIGEAALVVIAAFVVFQQRSKVKTKRDLSQILGKGEKS